jgi:uncharacterized sporulation protein YeaH/YhbH (DUF444 family)
MTNIIDRRLNPKDKALRNRQKFIQRSREQIKEAVKEAINDGKITDIETIGKKTKIKVKGISEPTFGIDSKTGNKKYVLPGNKEHIVGDKSPKPKDGDGAGGTKGGLGQGEDDFEFLLNQDEFLDFIFEDLELPDLIKKQIKDVTKVKPKRAGYTNVGNPSQLDVVKSLKNSLGRRIGLGRPDDEEIKKLEEELAQAELDNNAELIVELADKLIELKRKQSAIPWLDPFDVRYRNFIPTPQPITQAVMFCIMDVSGSMGQKEKDLAKRFFFLLHMFLKRKYNKLDIIFIRHHESASEVDEETFFTSRESGGTVVSTAVKLADKIIQDRYNLNDWNIYVAQISDGDNYTSDNVVLADAINTILPKVQYYAYVEIFNMYKMMHQGSNSDVWDIYEEISNVHKHLKLKHVADVSDIWPVFKKLFTKQGALNG